MTPLLTDLTEYSTPTLYLPETLESASDLPKSSIAQTTSIAPVEIPSQKLGRVLHVINGEHYSGAERVQDLLGLRLPELGYDVDFACLKPGRFPAMRRSQGKLHELNMRSRWSLGSARKLAKLIKSEQYDLIHTHTPRTAMIGRIAAKLAGVPMVYHVHSPTARDTTHPWRNRINTAVERMSLLGNVQLITVSNSLAQHMQAAGYNAGRISVVPNGVPVATIPPARKSAPFGVWTIGTVALIRPRKGIEILLDAVALLRQEGVPVRLLAVGPFETPEYEQAIRQHVAELRLEDAVEFAGFTSDVNAALARMDLFVLPSLFGEGLPMVVLEAMAAGVPVIGTRVEGTPEAVRDGQDGLLADPGDSEDLARAIARVVRGRVSWEKLRASALERQAAKFSDFSMAQGVAGVYRHVLATRQRASN